MTSIDMGTIGMDHADSESGVLSSIEPTLVWK